MLYKSHGFISNADFTCQQFHQTLKYLGNGRKQYWLAQGLGVGDLGSRQSHSCHLLVVWPWASHILSRVVGSSGEALLMLRSECHVVIAP